MGIKTTVSATQGTGSNTNKNTIEIKVEDDGGGGGQNMVTTTATFTTGQYSLLDAPPSNQAPRPTPNPKNPVVDGTESTITWDPVPLDSSATVIYIFVLQCEGTSPRDPIKAHAVDTKGDSASGSAAATC